MNSIANCKVIALCGESVYEGSVDDKTTNTANLANMTHINLNDTIIDCKLSKVK